MNPSLTHDDIAAVRGLFSECISAEIDAHAPLEYDDVFDRAHDYVRAVDEFAVEEVERLAGLVADLLVSARALR